MEVLLHLFLLLLLHVLVSIKAIMVVYKDQVFSTNICVDMKAIVLRGYKSSCLETDFD